MRKVILFIILPLFIGCASAGHKLNPDQAAKIEKGVTTREQVINYLGSPDQITQINNGDVVFSYHYVRTTIKPQTLIPYIGLFIGGSNLQNQFFTVTFGPDGIVKNTFTTHGSSESNLGIMTGSKPDVQDTEQNKR